MAVVRQIFTFSSSLVSFTNLGMEGKNGWKGKIGGKEGSRGGVKECVQVWDTPRWITQPNRQFITVGEGREGKRECGKRKGKKGIEGD